VIAVGQEHRREEYVTALINEIQNYEGQRIKTIYLGGGTPSLLDEGQLECLMDAIRKKFLFHQDIEITIEANPESISRSKAQFLKAQGFNRVSLGVQSLNDRYLKFLGRRHDARMACDAYRTLRDAGLVNINLDLMYAFPGQTQEELIQDARDIALLGPAHLSLYTLTIEPNSRFFASQMKLDDDEKLAGQYVLVGGVLHEYGFEQYEISNFSKPGFESAHNKNYWLGGTYIGLGVGAHGFDGRRRYWNTPNFQDYIQRAGSAGQAIGGFEDLTDAQLIMEKILFGLRMNEGVPWDLVPPLKQKLVQTWIKDGFLLLAADKLKTTDRGRLVLDELSVRLI
jgi:oxygen-independent coproporphyrinogen-3 oxidase